MLIHIFLVVGNDRFSDGLADSVDLGCMATTRNSYSNINMGEFVKASDEDGFVNLGVDQ